MLSMACITILCFNLTHFSWYIFILVLISSQSIKLISNSSPQGYTRATCSMDRSSFTEKIKTESTARYSSLLTCKCRFLSAISTFEGGYTWENPPIRRYGAISGACIIYQNRQNLVYFKYFIAFVLCSKILREFFFCLTVSWNVHAALSLPLFFCLDRGITMYNTRPETEHVAPWP